jgi:hypothetical protein
VHLTHTTLVCEALCGEEEPVVWDGEPDAAVICSACDELARALGLDPAAWMRVEAELVLQRAA